MTRYTNVGRKRTYVAAGFNYREPELEPEASTSALPAETDPATTADAPPKKKRKKSKKEKGENVRVKGDDAGDASRTGDSEADTGEGEGGENGVSAKSAKGKKGKEKVGRKQKGTRRKDAADRAAATEKRRLKRIAERHVNKVCFACREMGHAAQMCPNVKQEGDSGQAAVNIAGICYRCGSKKHTLSRCKKPVDEANPLPFASCFVCKGKGHLASSCPQNKEKGIYPNGGSCKLCGETNHLARDCPMRKADINAGSVFLGIGREAGADEDDFHTFRRKNVQVDRELQGEERIRKSAKVRAGKHSGIVKAFGFVPQAKAKKVVNF
ncbi:hypothetical protein K488DRAFT_79454 [Vararia minispora EC-137]|uniref:Uncharacterized protein n=1 Tax=Vararia minispora EC-137 TaxID=1314806 RepID=A0ACB8QGH3_9AGAM|nr:hypothetical protein K488DRAFT_79454 [Vararia minispora EC-137]